MRLAFPRWRSEGLFNRPSPRKRLLPKKKTSSGFEFVSGLADGASAMPAKWSRPAFSFRFYEGKISRALRIGALAAGTKPRKKASPCPQKIDDGGSTEGRPKRDPIGLRSKAATQAVYFFAAGRRRRMNPQTPPLPSPSTRIHASLLRAP